MDTAFDILTGIGLGAAAGIRPFLPALVAGAVRLGGLPHRLRRDRPRRSSSRSGWLLAIVLALIAFVLVQRRMTQRGARREPARRRAGRPRARRRRAALRRRARRPVRDVWWPGLIGGIACALLAQVAVARPAAPHPRAPGPRGARGAHRLRRRRVAACSPSSPSSRPRSPCIALGGARLAAHQRPPPRGREVRGPAHPALTPWPTRRRKLVLAVIDGMKPSALERAVATGTRADARAADGARDLRRRLLRRVPLRHPGVRRDDRHRHAPGPPPHPVDELVVARGEALRRVRLELRRGAAAGHQPPARRHGLQHEHGAPVGGDADGVRVRSTTPSCGRPGRRT